jgi:integrase
MELAYLSGQRPDDVIRFSDQHVVNDTLRVRQGKTNKFLQIELSDPVSGERSALGLLIDQIRARPVRGTKLLSNMDGTELTRGMLRTRFEAARESASSKAAMAGDMDLAERIRQFQFRDIRPKAASEIEDIKHASKLLGHSEERITRQVYRRVGERVKPTK